jgi:tetratricopeptide (TPR) repeat protein
MTVPASDPDGELAAAEAEVARYRDSGDRPALANALIFLSAYLERAARYAEAVAAAEEGVGLYRDLGDQAKLLWALENLAYRYSADGQNDAAVTTTAERVQIYRDNGDRSGLAGALIFLSAYLERAARNAEAVATAIEGVGHYRELDDRAQLAWALQNLLGRYAAAPGLRVQRALLSAPDAALLRAVVAEYRLDAVGGIAVTEDGSARVESYTTAAELDLVRGRGVAVEIVDEATATWLARQDEVGRGNRFADGGYPTGVGILTGE